MAVQSLQSIGTYVPDLFSSNQNVGNSTSSLLPDSSGQQASSNSVGLSAEYYLSDSMSLQFSNKDGDTVTLNMQQVEYAKAQLQVQDNGTMSDQDWQSVVDKIKDEFKTLQSQIMNQFITSMGGTVDQSQNAPQTQDSSTAGATNTQDAAVPAYWNADNTSQRIVDFATSFLKGFSGAGSDFLAKIKDAIDEGFKEAEGEMGKVPDSVSKLTQDTHDLVMSKLDAWAKAQGIAVDDGNSDGNAAAQQTADATTGAADQTTSNDEQVLASLTA